MPEGGQISHCQGCLCHGPPIKSSLSQTSHQRTNQDQQDRPGYLHLALCSEAWATSLADRRRLDVFDMRCQRRLRCVFRQQHVSNQSIRERTKQPTAASLLRQRRLRCFGHLHRMPSSLPVRRVFDFNPSIFGWKISRSRPKTRWGDSIKHDLHSAGLDKTPMEVLCLRTANARTRARLLSQVSHNVNVSHGETLGTYNRE